MELGADVTAADGDREQRWLGYPSPPPAENVTAVLGKFHRHKRLRVVHFLGKVVVVAASPYKSSS